MDTRKEKTYFPFVLLVLVVALFWDVFFMRTTLYMGDYAQQFYPWLSFYSENIKNLQLPLWTRHVQSGFPIFAEGQTGMLYPLNLVFFFILPFKIAYNYSFLFHYFLAGLFMYLYCRKIKMDIWGSSIAAGLLCLSTVYAGSFINVTEKSRNLDIIHQALKDSSKGADLDWIRLDKVKMEGQLLEVPARTQIPVLVQEQMIVELYSK